ncbi:MAG: amidase, partial [Hyphomicrobiales bacterium]|nr:amidase [Hyphomicrobiales bacterium]
MTAPLTSGPTLEELAAELESGRVTSRALVEKCLSRIDDPAGEGSKAFMAVAAPKALALADAFDALRANGAAPSRFAGIPISVKDLFDLAGEVTRAGSMVLANAPAANADAEAVRLLKRAGFIVIGRTNMSEFAFSGLGINPHYGTPRGVWDRKTGRVPGGSSSGAAVSVVDGMA